LRKNRWGSGAAAAGMGIILLLALAACGRSEPSSQKTVAQEPSAPNAVLVKVEASKFKWTLDRTEFQAGQPIRFQLEGKDGTHGFSIVGTGVSQPVKAGESGEVAWTPEKPGEYTIKCNLMCGSGHSSMETQITVK
jgi:cytochrome c oxidase subunit 2